MEAKKSLNIGSKVLVRRSNVMWDILLQDVAKSLAGSILTAKSVRLQTEYMGTRKTRIRYTGCPCTLPRTIWIVYCQIWKGRGCLIHQQQSGHCHRRLCLAGENDQQMFLNIPYVLPCCDRSMCDCRRSPAPLLVDIGNELACLNLRLSACFGKI